jgi:hypothetical protein
VQVVVLLGSSIIKLHILQTKLQFSVRVRTATTNIKNAVTHCKESRENYLSSRGDAAEGDVTLCGVLLDKEGILLFFTAELVSCT